ncbi:MAG: hypothetical protein ACP5G0_00775 [Desulfomonilia bacterium]
MHDTAALAPLLSKELPFRRLFLKNLPAARYAAPIPELPRY